MKNPFFLNTGPHEIDELLKSLKLKLFGINDSVKDAAFDVDGSTAFVNTLFDHSSNYDNYFGIGHLK